MANTVGDLFINIGLTGAEKAAAGINTMKDGLGDAKTMAIDTKVALLAMVYGFEQMTAASNSFGASMENLKLFLGGDAELTKTMQQYENLGKQFKITAGETDAVFLAIRKIQEAQRLSKPLPAGYGFMQGALSRAGDTFDLHKLMGPGGIEYGVGQALKTLKLMEHDLARNYVAESLGMSSAVIGGWANTKFNQNEISKQPYVGESALNRNAQSYAGWERIATKFEIAFSNLNAEHGLQIVTAIEKLTTQLISLIATIDHAVKILHVPEVAESVWKYSKMPFDFLVDQIQKATGKTPDQKEIERIFLKGDITAEDARKAIDLPVQMARDFLIKLLDETYGKGGPHPATPKAPDISKPTSQNNVININQELSFEDGGENVADAARIHKDAITQVVRNLPTFQVV